MTIKYLKSTTTSSSAVLNLGTVSTLLANLSLTNRAFTIANSTVSTNTVTGALVVQGGVGIGGNLFVGGSSNVEGAFTALSANFTTNATIAGALTSTNINNSGLITSGSGTIGILNSTTMSTTGLGTFGSLQVNTLANIGTVNAISGTIATLSATSVNTGSLSAQDTVAASTVTADNVSPRTGQQINFGTADKLRITGGNNGQVLGTDGNGNLAWIDGPGALNVGTGLIKVGNTISLAGTGFAAGVYNTVTVDIYGRIVSGTNTTDTLDTVVSRGASTGVAISLTNATNSTSVASGALVISGGLGVAQTITANQLVSKTTITAEQTLIAQDTATFAKTALLNGVDSGTVPLRIKPGNLISGASSGSIEFDGNYLYITTTAGRQILAARDVNAPPSPVAAVKAVASRNININAATQLVTINGDTVDCWDEVSLLTYDRVLLPNQTDPAENGVYVYQGEGQALIRALDFTALTGIYNGTVIFVAQGAVNGGSYYEITTEDPISVGSTAITFTQLLNKNVTAIANLPKNTESGLISRTEYGTVALRSLASNSSWITVSNADAKSGNPTINTGTVPVVSGGTGRTNIIGWMRGTGTAIVSSQTIPLANIAGAGTMASQNANSVNITGGTVAVSSVSASTATVTDIANINTVSVSGSATVTGATTLSSVTANTMTVANLTVNGPISGSTIAVSSMLASTATVTGTANISTISVSGNATVAGTTTLSAVTANTLTVANLLVSGSISASTGLTGNTIALGANSTGSLSTAAVTVSAAQNVTDAIALMNVVLGKLVPPPPPNFPASQTLSIGSLTTARMTNFVQTDNTQTQGQSVAGGTTITNIRRSSSYQTNTITNSGPGDTGTVTVTKNSSVAGSKSMVAGGNGTFNDLVIVNNQDYSLINTAVAANFWYSFDCRASGTVSAGWNEVTIAHSAAGTSNTAQWYYDSSSPGTPQFSNAAITEDANVVIYSSSVPHYTTSTRFDLSFNVNRLSGDTYPTSNNFAVGASGGAFDAPVTLTYTSAGVTTPLARNLYVAAGSLNATTTANIRSGFGSSSAGPSITVDNSYATATQNFTPGVTVLYKTGTSNQIEETSIPVNSVGTGSGNAYRIVNPGSTDTPSYTASAAAFVSDSSTLNTYDAAVVAAILSHNQTNYSTGYMPIGPNLSVGRNGSQYFTFKFVRTVVSKFDIKYTGTISGLYVALPGSAIDTSSTLNGWIDAGLAYNGSGIPGAGTGGNGSNGAAIGGVAVFNSAQTNRRVTVTFGTASSSGTATNEIYVRVKLSAGQSLTALSIETASN